MIRNGAVDACRGCAVQTNPGAIVAAQRIAEGMTQMTPVQVRMARAALDVSPEELSRRAGLSPEDVVQLERGGQDGMASAKLRATLEAAGVAFLEADGVRYDARMAMARTVPLEEMNSYNDE